uniref:ATP synthase complex subunit 8 n=1 Tax=Schistometopum gregorii TaxID=260982 RepID=W5RH74_9AMPH|nr:ATP synthase F0 subunit 8 [Schistometopum gregorii]AGZ19111.1 ATP synthase F0 subunit 8 [Schistometopum gregorii]
MPQLNPNPWLFIMISSWIIILMILLTKIIKHKPMSPTSLMIMHKHFIPWNWPW